MKRRNDRMQCSWFRFFCQLLSLLFLASAPAFTNEPPRNVSHSEVVSSQRSGIGFKHLGQFAAGGLNTVSIAEADLNGDGELDIVTASMCLNQSDCTVGSVGVLLGSGHGQFQPAVSYSSGGYSTHAVSIADVNRDGIPDLIVASECSGSLCNQPGQGAVGVLIGNGDGTFQPPVSYGSGSWNATSVDIADVNHDGSPDLVISNLCLSSHDCNSGAVSVLIGNGDGTFQGAVTYKSAGEYGESVVAADVTEDGNLDLVVSNQCQQNTCLTGAVSVFAGNGDGTFQPPVSYNSVGGIGSSLAVGDFNKDGHLDIAVADLCADYNCDSSGLTVLLGNGDGTFQPAVGYSSGGEPFINGSQMGIVIADFNGDSDPDIAITDNCVHHCRYNKESSGLIAVLLGNGDGTFQLPHTFGSRGFDPQAITIGDVNRDGRPDLLYVDTCNSGKNKSCNTGLVGILRNTTSR